MTSSIYKRKISRKAKLQNELEGLARGYIREKHVRDHIYYYLQYRNGKQVISKYVSVADKGKVEKELQQRAEIEKELKYLQKIIDSYESAAGIITEYRPVRNVDYQEYTLFMSNLAHDYKRLGTDEFLEVYDVSKYRGINKRYLKGYIDHILGITGRNTRKSRDLVLDPYTYQMYFEYGDKSVLEEELKKAVPAFLNQGLLVTNVQEAVDGTF